MVQTYVIEETKELIFDSSSIEEWKEKVNALQLQGQQTLINGDKSPVPFEFMNTVTGRIFETLCPQKSSVKEYNKTPIPLEILGLIQLAVNENHFDSIEIWYDDKSPDPVAIGIRDDKQNRWVKDRYLIGRWGDVLAPLEELKIKAIAIFKKSRRIELTREIAQRKVSLDNLDVDVDAHFDAQTDIGSGLF